MKPTRRQRKAARIRLERGNRAILRSCCRKLRLLHPRRLTRKEMDYFAECIIRQDGMFRSMMRVVPMDEV